MTNILNTWTSTRDKLKWFNLENEVYREGDYAIYKQFEGSFIYTYKNIALNCLLGFNKEHIHSLYAEKEPALNTSAYFIYKRALKAKQVGLNLLNHKQD